MLTGSCSFLSEVIWTVQRANCSSLSWLQLTLFLFVSGLCGHEEDRQRSWDGVCLPQAAGVPDPLGGGALQGPLLRKGGDHRRGGGQAAAQRGPQTVGHRPQDRICRHLNSDDRYAAVVPIVRYSPCEPCLSPPYLCLTGMSATARKRKEEVAQALKKLIETKGKTPAMKYQQLLNDLRGQSETVSVLNRL